MAQTVASFKTNGTQMADAIKNIGAVGKERPSSAAAIAVRCSDLLCCIQF
jgi:hypothetical protein